MKRKRQTNRRHTDRRQARTARRNTQRVPRPARVDAALPSKAHALTNNWYAPIDLAREVGVTRLTIYRWIAAGRLERRNLSPRCIRVRLKPQSSEPQSGKPQSKTRRVRV